MVRFPSVSVRALLIGVAVIGAGITAQTSALAAQTPTSDFRADYVVQVKDTAQHLFHVTATFSGIDQPSLDLALPVWTPGWYTLEYYAKNVRLFTVMGEQDDTIRAPLVRPQTWRIDTEARDRLVVEFDYFANVLGLNQAKITQDMAFFTGTQLFLEPVGHRDASFTVRFETPPGWGIATALTDTPEPNLFTASDYDALVDAPTWLGSFQVHEFEVLGKPHFIVYRAAEDFSSDSTAVHTERTKAMIRTTAEIFGGLPYDKYVVFKLPGQPQAYDGGALEHSNSYVGCCWTRTRVGGMSTHEFFHVWNVKRIRPAGMWPYDYSGPNLTASLWFSEGVTTYYNRKINFRVGRLKREEMLGALNMGGLESNPERHLVSLSDASMATWRDYLHEPLSYYRGGSLVGALLDVSILHDTRGEKGLDDVMRNLYQRYYKMGRGFTPEDLANTVSSMAGRDYTDFFRRFIAGVEIPPYDTILGYAGLRAVRQYLGVLQAWGPRVEQGRRLEQGNLNGPVGQAGGKVGDILVAIGGRPVDDVPFTPNGCCLIREQGDTSAVVLTLLRDGSRMDITVLPLPYVTYRIEAIADPTPQQLRVREAWLRRTPDSPDGPG